MSHSKRPLLSGGQAKSSRARFSRPPELTELQLLRAELAAERIKSSKLAAQLASNLALEGFNQDGTYDMDQHEEKLRLATDLWSDDYAPFMTKHRDANTVLGAILGVVVANHYKPTEECLELTEFKQGAQL